MKTIASVAYGFLQKQEQASFNDIWKNVYNEMKSQWKTKNPTVLLKDIEGQKMSELYVILTIDGRFIRMENSNFALVENFTYEEVKKIKINSFEQDNEDEELVKIK